MESAAIFKKLSQHELLSRWRALLDDPDAPERFELDEYGELLVTPTPSFWHQHIAAAVGAQLKAQLGGEAGSYPVATPIGVRLPDVCWAESFVALAKAGGSEDPLLMLPPICVEIVSARNKRKDVNEKVPAYLQAGAQEVIVIAQNEPIRYFTSAGESDRSSFPVSLQLPTW